MTATDGGAATDGAATDRADTGARMTVVVATRDRCDRLRSCLNALTALPEQPDIIRGGQRVDGQYSCPGTDAVSVRSTDSARDQPRCRGAQHRRPRGQDAVRRLR